MKFFTAASLVAIALTAESAMAASQTCVVGTLGGECVTTSACSSNGGSSTAGHCPGAANIQCCTYPAVAQGQCMPETLCTGTASAGHCPGPASIKACAGQPGNLSGYNTIQSARARQIVSAVKSKGLNRQACLAAITTAITESSLQNYANSGVSSSYDYPYDAVGSDHDSVGLFQQRVSSYPSVSADMTPAQSATQFLNRMVTISGWQTMAVGTLCQKVQVSAYPDRYNDNVGAAGNICTALGF